MRQKTKLLLGMLTLFISATVLTNSIVSATSVPTASELVIAQRRNAADDEQQIIKAILQDNQPISPQAPIKVDKIAIISPYALAIVLVGEHGGGMSALMKKQGVWQVIGGGGGAVDERNLVELGVPNQTARTLMQKIEER